MANFLFEISADVNRYLNIDELTTLTTVSTNSFYRGLNNMKFHRFTPKESGKEILRKYEYVEKVKLSDLKEISNVNIVNNYYGIRGGNTPLHYAAGDSIEKVKLLIRMGADVNTVNKHGKTPLFFATEMDKMETVKLLIKEGANVNNIDTMGYTPFLLTVDLNNIELFKILLNLGANVNISTKHANTSLHTASALSNTEMVNLLIQEGVDVNAVISRRTPLHGAAQENNVEMAELLINLGANVNLTDRNGKTPLQLAIKNKNNEIVTMLEKAGAH